MHFRSFSVQAPSAQKLVVRLFSCSIVEDTDVSETFFSFLLVLSKQGKIRTMKKKLQISAVLFFLNVTPGVED